MKAFLVRVGIDLSVESGAWNAPVNPETCEFAYVPILENHKTKKLRSGYEVSYEQFKVPCHKLGRELPPRFYDKCAHLDPDFEYLTYGDEGNKGAQLKNLGEGDILAFWAGLSLPKPRPRGLVYALIGLYVVAEKPIYAEKIPKEYWYKNAHTRRQFHEDDIIVFGKRGVSGRLERCIPIGEYRDDTYRIRSELWDKWGGLRGEDRIQRGPHRSFCVPGKFYKWFERQNIRLMARNN